MDRKIPQSPEIRRLIRLSADARCCLTGEVAVLRRRLDIPSRIRGSLMDHPAAWLFGSLASGIVASLVFRRKPPSAKKHRSFRGSLLALTLTAARPLASIWLRDQLKHWVAAYQPASRLIARPAPTSKSL
jgi:hypothetical protein